MLRELLQLKETLFGELHCILSMNAICLMVTIRPRNHRSYHVVPAGHCWVEGDNGRSSNDSNHFGVVCTDDCNGSQCHLS